MSASTAQYDLIVYGAASFVGKILVNYLVQRHGVDGDLNWAIAGRNQHKLDALNAELGTELHTIIANADARHELDAMVARTRLVVSTVGPYDLYGSDLVAACVDAGVDYCDLTGEAQWMRKMIDLHQAKAEETGARIVHNCGFDSIPSDLGVHFLQQHAKAEFNEYCNDIRCGVKGARGGMSGGTVASLINVVKQASKDSGLRKELQNPYSVCPPHFRKGVRQRNVAKPEYDDTMQSWLAPWVMAAINTRVLHRSNALLDRAYGEDFKYDESMMMGAGIKGRGRATALAAAMGGFLGLSAVGPTRSALEKFVLPKPGEGPSPKEQENGFWDYRMYGKTPNGNEMIVKITGDRDPGYGSTAKMLGEAAACLAKDIAKKDKAGGFWTPATAMGDKLIDRLIAHAGCT
ncbi:MAG: saccharopine dehydrogenase NADP-binding domain-containing protein, partial [Gammaproteobacteria bacterium]|nr:saccharopine dehydrogenase NADP-binding domain-containing protein [Gammaproteobacteria bacterium]